MSQWDFFCDVKPMVTTASPSVKKTNPPKVTDVGKEVIPPEFQGRDLDTDLMDRWIPVAELMKLMTTYAPRRITTTRRRKAAISRKTTTPRRPATTVRKTIKAHHKTTPPPHKTSTPRRKVTSRRVTTIKRNAKKG